MSRYRRILCELTCKYWRVREKHGLFLRVVPGGRYARIQLKRVGVFSVTKTKERNMYLL